MLRAVGLTDDDFAKPQIGVVSAGNEVTPCNLTGAKLSEFEGRSPRRGWRRPHFLDDRRFRRDLDGPRRDARLAGVA